MIFGHEGQVRSGKSYEAVVYHILPALAAGRHVFFRLNGVDECAANIAAHLGKPEDEVRALMHPMGNQEVRDWLVCDSDNFGALTFPHVPKHSLVVVDEVHDFFPVGRAGLPDRTGNFFAMHGHISLDVVLMTQDFKEVHRSIVRRMGKKNFYTKLDGLGKENSYSVRFYTSPAAGKFELVGSEKRDYNPDFFKFYHGVQPGVESNEVYKSNTKTLWQSVKKPAIGMALALLVGIFFIGKFFTGGGVAPQAEKPRAKSAPVASVVPQASPASPIPAAVARVLPGKAESTLPAGVAYVLGLAKDARPRYAGEFQGRHLLEWRSASGQVIERLTSEQLVGLGWTIEATSYGAILRFKDEAQVFTAWPVDLPYQQSDATARRIEAAGPPVVSLGEQQPAPAVPVAASASSAEPQQVASYGGFRQ